MRKLSVLLLLILVLSIVIPSYIAYANGSRYLQEYVDISGPLRTYKKAGVATLKDLSKNGYMILSLSASPQASHQLLDIISNTYGKFSDIPGIADYLPGSEYIDLAQWGMNLVDDGLRCYMQLRDPNSDEVIWDGQWKDEYNNDHPFKTGKVIELGNDHKAYELWFRYPDFGQAFIKLDIGDNVYWSDNDE